MIGAIGIRPGRVYAASYMTSLNAPGFSLSLLNTSRVKQLARSIDVYALLDAPTGAPAWSGVQSGWRDEPRDVEREEVLLAELRSERRASSTEPTGQADRLETSNGSYWREADVSTARVGAAIRGACVAVLAATGDMTEFDTVVGDGDCGETFAAGAKGQCY